MEWEELLAMLTNKQKYEKEGNGIASVIYWKIKKIISRRNKIFYFLWFLDYVIMKHSFRYSRLGMRWSAHNLEIMRSIKGIFHMF